MRLGFFVLGERNFAEKKTAVLVVFSRKISEKVWVELMWKLGCHESPCGWAGGLDAIMEKYRRRQQSIYHQTHQHHMIMSSCGKKLERRFIYTYLHISRLCGETKMIK